MRETSDIIVAFDGLAAQGKPSAMATVVGVEGSAYRRPGARMLVAEDGRTWGGVSGGCLERDVADRARGVIDSGRPLLCRYDTSDEESIERGVTTGCGGTIEVLIRPLDATRPGPVHFLKRVLAENRPLCFATVVKAEGAWAGLLGVSFDETDTTDATDASSVPDALLRLLAKTPLSRRHARMTARTVDGWADVSIDRLTPAQRLVLIGGGPDVVPVVTIAKTLGWRVAVVGARPATTLHERFAHADERYVTSSDAPLAGVPVGDDDALVVMTHNLARDAAVLAALTVRPRYVGVLGPQHRARRLLAALPPDHPARDVHSPMGLDLGAEAPEEIALSIVSEIHAELRQATGTPLNGRVVPGSAARRPPILVPQTARAL